MKRLKISPFIAEVIYCKIKSPSSPSGPALCALSGTSAAGGCGQGDYPFYVTQGQEYSMD